MLLQAALVCGAATALHVPVAAPTLTTHVQQQVAVYNVQQPVTAPSTQFIFPTTNALAVGYEGEANVYTEEDKSKARTAGLGLLFFGIAPSIWAQNELVWSKKDKENK